MNKRQRKKHGGATRRRRNPLTLTLEGNWAEIGDAVRDPVSQGLLRSAVTCFLKNLVWPPVTELKRRLDDVTLRQRLRKDREARRANA